jgi:hypothetical protein
MSEIEILKRLGRELEPPSGSLPDSLRYRALNGARARASRPRLPWMVGSAALAGGLAVFAFITIAPTDGPGTRATRPGTISAPTVLHHAALAAYEADLPTPQANQFIFTEVVSIASQQIQQPNGVQTNRGVPMLVQSWHSVDGRTPGLARMRLFPGGGDWLDERTIPGCQDGRNVPREDTNIRDPRNTAFGCTPQPAFDPSLPTAADAMLNRIREMTRVGRIDSPVPQESARTGANQLDQLAFRLAADLLRADLYLIPQQRGALFDALAGIPGIAATDGAHDFTGRIGVGVGMPGAPLLIFDPRTFVFLGSSDSSIVRQGVVDQPGQLPA